MNDKQIQQYLTSMNRVATEINKSKASSRAFLVEVGIVDENGHLTEHYRADVHSSSELAAGVHLGD